MSFPSVTIQITPDSKPAMPSSWVEEGAAFAHVLTHTGLLKTIQGQVRLVLHSHCPATITSSVT